MRNSNWFAAFVAAVALTPAAAQAVEADFFARLDNDAWFGRYAGLHGAAIAAGWLTAECWALQLTYNTDTLDLRTRITPSEAVALTFGARGEMGYAQLLPDYVVDGERISTGGHLGSYAEAFAASEFFVAPHNSVALELAARQWYIDARPASDGFVTLPGDPLFVTARARYTLWNLEPDAAWSEPHRLWPRLDGWALSVEPMLRWRSENRAWSAAPGETAGRNDADALAPGISARLRGGRALGDYLRAQGELSYAGQWGADDLDRTRVGGSTPYFVEVPGLPWAALVSSQVVASRGELRLGAGDVVEYGPAISAAIADDPRRVGETDEFGVVVGMGGVVDIRWRGFQVDVRGGGAPGNAWGGPWSGSIYAGFGWGT
jgi:hypothetical protein